MAFGVIQAKMPFLLVVLLALLRQKITDGKNINSFAGPFSLYAERYYMCELNRSLPWEWFIHASRFNPYKPRENQKLTGNFTARNLPADDSWWGTIILDLWANNQWKENAFVFTKKNDACTAIKVNIPGFYELFNKKRETKGRCIIKQGIYVFENFPIRYVYPNVPIMPYGRYRFKMMAGKTDSCLCLLVDFKIIPKVD